MKYEFLEVVSGDKSLWMGFDENENFYIRADGIVDQASLNLLNALDGFNFVTTDSGVSLYRIDYLVDNFFQNNSEERDQLLSLRRLKNSVDFHSTLCSEGFFKW